jgi:hypothetical protein
MMFRRTTPIKSLGDVNVPILLNPDGTIITNPTATQISANPNSSYLPFLPSNLTAPAQAQGGTLTAGYTPPTSGAPANELGASLANVSSNTWGIIGLAVVGILAVALATKVPTR